MASPRWDLVVERANGLLDIAAQFGAHHVALCGSVARRDDHDGSDIDLYVGSFELVDDGGPEDKIRASDFVKRIRAALDPYSVDIRPLPAWPLDADYEAAMQHDAIPLERLVQTGMSPG